MKTKLFDYIERDNIIFNLSGSTKLLCSLFTTFAVMFSFDIRFITAILLFSFVVLRLSGITLKQIKLMLIYATIFILLNFVFVFIFSPTYATEIYGTYHEIFTITSRYIVTQEQLLYQVTQALKYFSIVPIGMIFLLSTNPSEFASSISRSGVPYKIAYAFSLTLRYFPDLIRDYNDISAAQQCRGLDLSKKEKFSARVKNIMTICIPLVFSTIERIDMISNTMDLRSFGKSKKRTWYVAKSIQKSDIIATAICLLFLLISLALSIFVNKSRFYNPFI